MFDFLTLAAITLGPIAAICIYFYVKDSFREEPIGVLFFCFLFGMISTIPAALFETFMVPYTNDMDNFILRNVFSAYLIIGFSEEFVKFFILRFYVEKQTAFDEPFDGIVYSVFISMGFATLENIAYVYDGGIRVALSRMYTAIPAHATFAVLMGHFYGLSKMKRYPSSTKYLGLLIAIIFHGSYDFFLMISNNTLIALGAFVSLLVGIRYSFRAIKIHKELEAQQQNHFD